MQYVMFKEKHGNRIFLFTNEEEFHDVLLYVFRARLSEGYWYETADLDNGKINKNNPERIKVAKFMKSRTTSEYEGYERGYVEKFH